MRSPQNYVLQHPPIYTYVSQAVSFHQVFQLELFTSLISIMCDIRTGQISHLLDNIK